MADKKISQLSTAATPLAGTESVPLVQSGSTLRATVSELTAGRQVSAAGVAVTGTTVPANGVYLPAANTLGISTNSTNAVRVESNGNVGISAGNAPTQVLSLYRAGSTQTAVSFGNSNSGVNGTVVGVDTAGNAIISQTQALTMTFSCAGLNRVVLTAAGNVSVGAGAVATTATNGFLYVPTCAGTPTGTPTTVTGFAPIVVDTTNNKLYFYSGGVWRDAGP
jgi:hypothetical protein